MGEAEVIPIGGRGRPGRGSPTTPSAAARALAPPARTRAARTTQAAPATPSEPQPAKRRTPRRRQPAPPEQADAPVADATGAAGRGASRPPPRKRASKKAAPPEPTPAPDQPGVSADDLADAISDAARDVFGDDDWQRTLAELLALARRRLTGDYAVDDFGFDAELTERFLLAALRPVAERWFRVEVRGVDNIPAQGGALVVSNHSGTVPVDTMVTGLVIHDHAARPLRMLAADLVFALPFVGELARKGGATLASNEDAELLLSRGELVGVWPEGFKGIGKPFSERYKLQRFGRGGFVAAALRTGVPIVPCSVVGAEEIYPLIGNVASLARLIGVPYIPITPFFPWLGLLGLIPLPSKWLIEFGEPIRTDTYPDGAADDPMLVFDLTDQVRETIQQTLYSLLVQRRSVFS